MQAAGESFIDGSFVFIMSYIEDISVQQMKPR